jgi:ATP-dependent DNA helicase RecG
MSLQRAEHILAAGEGMRVEYKEARKELPKNLFESVCAMLNRDGGDIILGADDKGNITGVAPEVVESMCTNLVNLSNNPQKLEPPFILYPAVHEIAGEKIIHIQVPASSQVHKSRDRIYDRSNDGDFHVKEAHQIAEIYNRKRTHYSEGIVYPALRFSDFNPELFPKVRNLMRSNQATHPWLALNDEQLLQTAGLWRRDFQTGQEGYTLAAALLFGQDEVIQQILPHYKIDAILRRENLDRFDDRLYIQTNLIDAYEQLMGFVAKHLPDKFYLEGDQRISLRTKIFREVVANLIVHREYTNAYPGTFVIGPAEVRTENANNPHGEGPIDLHNFAPFPKNPAIAKFFIQLGRVDELGSGVLNVNKYISAYAGGGQPQFIEGPVFRIIIPLAEGITRGVPKGVDEGVNDTVRGTVIATISDTAIAGLSGGVKARAIEIIRLLYQQPMLKVADLMTELDVAERTIKEDLKRLADQNLIVYQGSKKTGGYTLSQGLHDKLHDKLA